MRIVLAMIFMFTSAQEVLSCGLRAASSAQNLMAIAEQTEAPASQALPKLLIYGSDAVVVKNEKGEEIPVDQNLVVKEGMTISSRSGKAQILLPQTGQVIELLPETTLQVLTLNKSSDKKICSVSFAMQSGRASFSSNHVEREQQCKPAQEGVFEVVTNNVAITPVGTKYNVDLNQAIAELNGENYQAQEEVSVEKGAVKLRLLKVKKSKNAKPAKEENLAASDYVFDDQKPVTVKAGRKAKIKKSKKDRLADIQVVYPE